MSYAFCLLPKSRSFFCASPRRQPIRGRIRVLWFWTRWAALIFWCHDPFFPPNNHVNCQTPTSHAPPFQPTSLCRYWLDLTLGLYPYEAQYSTLLSFWLHATKVLNLIFPSYYYTMVFALLFKRPKLYLKISLKSRIYWTSHLQHLSHHNCSMFKASSIKVSK